MTSVVDNLDGTFTWHFSNSTSFITPSLIGLPGKSTYEVAVDGGFVGTEADWLLYLEATSRIGNAIGNTDGNTTGNTVGNTIGNTPAHIWDGTSLSFSTNDAKDEFGSSVDLVGPAGNGIVSVIRTAGTGAAGTIDTYTITYSDTTTSTFNVYNGADGLGSGDMLKAVYDTTNNGIVDNAELVNGLTVETAVPSGALFTDTVYNDTTITTNVANLTTTVQSALAELDSGKADVATTLSGYGITDAYTKTETDALHDSLSVASVGQSVSYFLGDTLITGGNYDLANSPDGDVETIVSKLAVAAGTPYFMERYISDPIGGTTIDGGLWILRTHAAVSADNGVSEIVCRINKRTIKDGTITVTGTGTSRTITATSPIFAAGDANTSILSATLIETPTETFWISSYTSATKVTATTDNVGYINETAVQLHMYYKLFEATTGEINGATAKLYETQTIQPSFNILPADSILIAYFARTTSTNKTIRIYKGGTQHYSHIVTPIVYRHNNLKGLNEGDYKHLTTAQLGLVTSALQVASIGSTVQAYNANTTTAGNTFNGVSQLVKLDGTGKLPAIDGSQLTGLSASDVTKLPLAGGTMTGAITSLREKTVAMGASDMNLATGNSFTKTITTTTTLTFSNIPASGQLIVWKLSLTNAGAFATTFPTINWVLPDGTYSTSIATYLAANAPRTALKTSGVDTFIFYTENGGSTVYGKLF